MIVVRIPIVVALFYCSCKACELHFVQFKAFDQTINFYTRQKHRLKGSKTVLFQVEHIDEEVVLNTIHEPYREVFVLPRSDHCIKRFVQVAIGAQQPASAVVAGVRALQRNLLVLNRRDIATRRMSLDRE